MPKLDNLIAARKIADAASCLDFIKNHAPSATQRREAKKQVAFLRDYVTSLARKNVEQVYKKEEAKT